MTHILLVLHLLFTIPTLAQDSIMADRLLDSAEALEPVSQRAALTAYNKAAAFSHEQKYIQGEAKAYHYSGFVYTEMGKYDSSLICFYKAATLYEKMSDYWGIGACYGSVANSYQFMAQYDSSLANYQRAIDLFTVHNLEAYKRNLHVGKGRVLFAMKAYKPALNDYETAERLAIKYKDSAVLAQAIINQGAVYFELQQPEESLVRQQRALEIGRLTHNDYIIQIAAVNLADHYNRLRRYDSALVYANLAFEKAELVKSQYAIIQIQGILAGIYMEMGDHKAARRLLEEGLNTAQQINSQEGIAEVYNKLQQSYSKTGDYANAYKFLTLYKTVSDSILSNKHLQTIGEMEIKHHSAQKDAAITQGKLVIQRKNNLLISILSIASCILLIMVLLIQHNRFQHKLQKERLQTLGKGNEVKLLEAAMNGEEKEMARIATEFHDGVSGMLAAIKMHLSQLQQVQPSIGSSTGFGIVLRLLDDASQEVRKTAHNLMPEMEFGLDESLHRFCKNIGKNSHTKVVYHTMGNIPRCLHSFELAVYRITQELVHYAIRHANADSIMVQLSEVALLLSVTVEDNGKGLKATEVDGTGFLSLKSRVKTLNGTIEWNSSPNQGTSVYAEFDIIQVIHDRI
ncbi:tetratricopeptide repeat-containing sensor histidine kinase [Chitinophaga silvatica]|nr:tetratricopeptide repeat protein [Chitinophaga silvatica]